MLRRCVLLQFAVVIAVCACPASRAADERRQEQDKCNSWIATARMVAEAWLDDELPRHYAAGTLAKAGAKLDGIAACGDSGRFASELKSAVSSGEASRVREAIAHRDAYARSRRSSP